MYPADRITRARLGDRIVLMLPAILLLLVNLYVFAYSIELSRSS